MSTSQCPYVEIRIPVPWGHVSGCWYGSLGHRPLLALHGWQDNAGSFGPLAQLIAPHMPVLAIDLPGHGRSSHFPAGVLYHTWDYVRLVRQLVQHFEWQRVSLLGHSMGGALTFFFAGLFPHLVDMVIPIDVAKTRYFTPDVQVGILIHVTEKNLIEDERSHHSGTPPLYTFPQLEELLHKGSDESVDLQQCKHILARNVTPHAQQPDKFYFTRDRRIKYLYELYMNPAMMLTMAERIRQVNYLVIKAQDSIHFGDERDAVIEMLRRNNPNFEVHSVPNTTHHLHLNNAEEVAALIVPFVLKYGAKDEKQCAAKVAMAKL